MFIMPNEVVLWFLAFCILFFVPPFPSIRAKKELVRGKSQFNALYFQIVCVGRPTYLNLYIGYVKVSTVGMVINQMLA